MLTYRARRRLKRLGIGLLVMLAAAIVIWGCWVIWLERYVVYSTDENGEYTVTLDFSRGKIQEGVVVGPAEEAETVPIRYNEGLDATDTSTELKTLTGYYADTATILEMGVDGLREKVEQIPAGMAVMLDLKSIFGNFYYSTSVGAGLSDSVDLEAMDDLIQYLNQSGYYLIARVPAFRDRAYGLANTSCGLPTSSGYLWSDEQACYWLNPTSTQTLTYLIQIATELRELGFDEVVFTEFCFPNTSKIVFSGDKTDAITTAAASLVTACATDRFAVSFDSDDASFPLPEGRSRLYLHDVDASQAASVAQSAGVTDTSVNLVFLTETNDTRFNDYGVLRPVDTVG